MNKIVVVGDHYAAENTEGRVVGVVCRSFTPDKWTFHPVVNDPGKTAYACVSLESALDVAKDWAA